VSVATGIGKEIWGGNKGDSAPGFSERTMEKSDKIAVFAIGMNLVLFALKFTFAVLSHSIALKAEAFHSLFDVVASLTVFGGLMLAKRKSKRFPYWLYKVENLVSIIVALALFFAGYEIIMGVLNSGAEHQLENVPTTLISVLCGIGITFVFSRYELKVGKEINSPSLVAEAQHICVDIFAGAVVLVGLLSINLDRIAAVIIVIFIAWSGVWIINTLEKRS
jgi:cation diffusion facilitator family transporter